MPIAFNHTIVAAHDKRESAEFVSELFGLPSPRPFGRFLAVALEHGATLDYVEVADSEEIIPQHYAFLVADSIGRIQPAGGPPSSTPMTAGAASTSRTPPVTIWRS